MKLGLPALSSEEGNEACVDEWVVADLLDGCVPDERRRDIEGHVADCPTCQSLLAGVVADAPGLDPSATPTELAPLEELTPGTKIGRYLLVAEIGRGGMGRVFSAFDPELDRMIALKVVRIGGPSSGRDGVYREARAMAQVIHPNVIHVYEVGRHGGLVFIAMELMEGGTLRDWLREQKRPLTELLRRFSLAGRGLAAAHAAGIVHRDFKPGNVMLGADGRVCVTDFGLARPQQPSEDSASSSGSAPPERPDAEPPPGVVDPTEVGVVVGTPRYMPPEQHAAEPVTALADQYAFCVSLWEATTGEPAFSGRRDKLVAAKRAGPPPWPRGTSVPSRVAAAVRRGLANDPAERWPSMSALLGEISSDRIVAARRRIGAAALGLVGMAAAAGASWYAAEPARCTGAAAELVGAWDPARRDQARSSMASVQGSYVGGVVERTSAALDSYAERWTGVHTDACETTARGERSSELMDRQMACLHRAKRGLEAISNVLLSSDAIVVQRAHYLVSTLPSLERCSDPEALAQQTAPPSPAEAESVDAARRILAAVAAASLAGRYAHLQAKLDEAYAVAADLEYGPLRTELHVAQGRVHERLGDYTAAAEAYKAALGEGTRWGQRVEQLTAAQNLMVLLGMRLAQPEAANVLQSVIEGLAAGDPLQEAMVTATLAKLALAQGDSARAIEMFQRVLELAEPTPEGDQVIADAHNGLAHTLVLQGEAKRAEEHMRLALAVKRKDLDPEHPEIATGLSNLAVVMLDTGDYAQAEQEQRKALEIRQRALEPVHADIATSHNVLANTLRKLGRYDEAELEHKLAIPMRTEVLGPEAALTAASHHHFGITLNRAGRHTEAEAALRQALRAREKTLGPAHREVASTLVDLARALSGQGRHAEAVAEARRAVKLRDQVASPDFPFSRVVSALAQSLREAGNVDEAEAALRRGLSRAQDELGERHPHTVSIRIELVELMVDRGHGEDALPLAEDVWVGLQGPDTMPALQARVAFLLARALPHNADTTVQARRRTLAARSLEIYDRLEGVDAEPAADVRKWIAALG